MQSTGQREDATISHEDALAYATATAKTFGVSAGRTVEFDRELAKMDIKGESAEGEASGKKTKKK